MGELFGKKRPQFIAKRLDFLFNFLLESKNKREGRGTGTQIERYVKEDGKKKGKRRRWRERHRVRRREMRGI